MPRTAFLFPGQGSQRVGMGRELLEQRPDLYDRYYRVADEILGFELSKLCWEGPVEALRQTEITQPAIFLTSLVILDLLGEVSPPDAVAGHSLGEYTALVCAQALDWTDALRLVRRRGELMAAVNEHTRGRMAAVLGLPADRVEELCAQEMHRSGEVVEVANYNDPNQVVISGLADAVDRVVSAAKAAGAERVVVLEVGAPFHCSLMREMEEQFAAELARVTFHDPKIPLVANATAQYVTDAPAVVAELRRQLAAPVRWTETLGRLAGDGIERFVEVGPGRVLSGFCRLTCPDLPVYSTGDDRRRQQALAALA